MSTDLITLVIAMREAQKAHEEKPTRTTLAEKEKTELRVDMFIQNYFADIIQLGMWEKGLAKKTDDVHAVYNAHDEKAENG